MPTKTSTFIFKLCLIVTLLSLLIFSVVVGWSYKQVQEKALKDAGEKVQLSLNEAREIVDKHLQQVEVSGYSLASIALQSKADNKTDTSFLRFNLDKDELLDEKTTFDILEQFLEANPHLWGAAIGFEPGLFPNYGEAGFSPFVRHADSSYVHYVLSEEKNNYREDDWYKETKRVDHPRWSEPFVDIRGAVIDCFCIPIHDKNDNYIGTIAVDLQLNRFGTDLLKEIHPFENSQALILDANKTCIVHPDQSMIMKQITTDFDKWVDSAQAQKLRIYSAPIKTTNWTIVLQCTEDDIYEGVNELTRRILRVLFIGLLLIGLCILFIIYQIRRFVEKQAGIDSELTIASHIQLGILPHNFPKTENLEIHALLHPAKEVGGDLYDYFIEGNILHFAIGDVSGKGIPASLYMAVTKSALRFAEGMNISTEEIVSRINNHLESGNTFGMFVTLFIGRLNLETGELTYCNAGHNPLVIAEPGCSPRFLDCKPNLAVGLYADFPYEQQTIQLKKDTHIILYTDGVTEAETAAKELYGNDRLLDTVETIRKNNIENAAEHICGDVRQFVNGNPQNDDITILSIHYS